MNEQSELNPHEKTANRLINFILIFFPVVMFIGLISRGPREELIYTPITKIRSICRQEKCFYEAYVETDYARKRVDLPFDSKFKIGYQLPLYEKCSQKNGKKYCKYRYEKSS